MTVIAKISKRKVASIHRAAESASSRQLGEWGRAEILIGVRHLSWYRIGDGPDRVKHR